MWERPGLNARPGLSFGSKYSKEEIGFVFEPRSLDLLR